MDRREFLITTGSAASLAPSGAQAATGSDLPSDAPAAPAIGRGLLELRLAMPWPVGSAGFGSAGERLARRIEAATEGRIRIEAHRSYGSGLEAVITATADLYFGTEHHHLTYSRAFAYFAGLPYFCGLEPQDLQAWLALGGGQQVWDELAAQQGVRAMLAGHTGRAPGLWATRPIDRLADLSGAPIYTLGLARDVARAIGADPVALAADELKAALTDGRLFAAEWAGARASLALGLPLAAKYHIGLGLNTSGTALSLGMRRTLWERLSRADQAVIEACAAEECRNSFAEFRAHEASVRTMLARLQGVQFESLPGDVMSQVSDAADAIVADLGEESSEARRVARSYMDFRLAVTGLEAPRARSATV